MNDQDDQARIEDSNRQLAAIMPAIEGASQEVLVESLMAACGAIVSILTKKQATGLTLEFGAAQLAHDFVTDNRGNGIKRRALNRLDPARAKIN